MSNISLKSRLHSIIDSAVVSKRYCKQTMLRSHKNVCVYGLGKFFRDVFEERGLKERFGVNYLSDSDNSKWGGELYGIKCVSPKELKNIEDLVIILLIGGDTTELEQQFQSWKIPYVAGYELLLEMSLGETISADKFEKNTILETFQNMASEQSKKIYTELLANRLAPEFSKKSYRELYSPLDYFNQECFPVTNQEAFVDCGAFDGDSIRTLLSVADDFESIYAFEIDDQNYKKLEQYTETLPEYQKEKIHCYHSGVWNETSVLAYGNEEKSTAESFSLLKSDHLHEISVDRLDNILKDQRVTFIKMDIEGAELKALMGAEEIIKTQKPKLAVCLYHKLEDFWEIPQYLKSILPEYQFELRHHCGNFMGTVLYANV